MRKRSRQEKRCARVNQRREQALRDASPRTLCWTHHATRLPGLATSRGTKVTRTGRAATLCPSRCCSGPSCVGLRAHSKAGWSIHHPLAQQAGTRAMPRTSAARWRPSRRPRRLCSTVCQCDQSRPNDRLARRQFMHHFLALHLQRQRQGGRVRWRWACAAVRRSLAPSTAVVACCPLDRPCWGSLGRATGCPGRCSWSQHGCMSTLFNFNCQAIC